MPNDYANPKVRALLSHVADFGPRDFLDAALAMLDQSCLRTASFNRAYAAVETVIAEEAPEGEEPTVDEPTVDMALAERPPKHTHFGEVLVPNCPACRARLATAEP